MYRFIWCWLVDFYFFCFEWYYFVWFVIFSVCLLVDENGNYKILNQVGKVVLNKKMGEN